MRRWQRTRRTRRLLTQQERSRESAQSRTNHDMVSGLAHRIPLDCVGRAVADARRTALRQTSAYARNKQLAVRQATADFGACMALQMGRASANTLA